MLNKEEERPVLNKEEDKPVLNKEEERPVLNIDNLYDDIDSREKKYLERVMSHF